ncbi:FliH/SctL family protein [Desulfosoma sp.]
MPSFKVLKGTAPTGWTPFAFESLDAESAEGRLPTNPLSSPGEDIGEAATDGANPLDELEQVIRQRLLEAERRAEELEREAYQKGYEQGRKDGYAFGASSIEKIRERLDAVAASLEALPAQVLGDYRRWLLEAALTLSRHLFQAAASVNPSVLENLVDEILDHMDRSQAITIVLHPKDRDLLEKHGILERWLAGPSEGAGTVRIALDPHISRGGCRVHSAFQEIDALVETRLKNLHEVLFAHESRT